MADTPDSQRLRAMKGLQAALLAIGGDGYHYDVQDGSVSLDPIDLNTLPDTTVLPFFSFLGPMPVERKKMGANIVKETIRVSVYGRVDADGTDEGRKLKAFEDVVADIELALSRNLQLGGAANDTWIEQIEQPALGPGNDNIIGVVADVVISLMPRTVGTPGGNAS